MKADLVIINKELGVKFTATEFGVYDIESIRPKTESMLSDSKVIAFEQQCYLKACDYFNPIESQSVY